MRFFLAWAAAPAIFALQGCALTDATISPPSVALVKPSSVGRGREVVVASAFADRRPMPDRCGMKRNGYGMETATIRCAVPPPAWIAESLKSALTASGFRVKDDAPAGTPPYAVRLDGAVLQFFVEPDVGAVTYSPEADISVKLVITSQSGLSAERTFYVKGRETALVGTDDTFEAAARDGTQEIVVTMVNALIDLLDRYPGLGAAASGPALSAVHASDGKAAAR